MRVVWALRLLCITGLASLHSGWAQPPASGKQTNGAGEPPPYEDRLIDSGNLAPLPVDDRDGAYNGQGWPRAWRIEAFTSNFDQGGVITRENGLTLNGRLDTPEYGGLSVDGILRTRPNSSIFTLWQRGLPFDNGWRANNGAGMLNTFGIDLSRSQYRFYLPTFPIAGVETEWSRSGAAQLQASVGEPGLYNGLRLSGFSRLGGNVFTTGGQWAIAPDAAAGFQFADAQGVRNNLDPVDPNAKISARSWYGGTAWRDGNTRLQFNLLVAKQIKDGTNWAIGWMQKPAMAATATTTARSDLTQTCSGATRRSPATCKAGTIGLTIRASSGCGTLVSTA
jgi:hypothetical protein